MNNKKFLIAALSLILLFTISCGDRPTGSSPSDGSIPKVTGTPVNLSKNYKLSGSGLTVDPPQYKDGLFDGATEYVILNGKIGESQLYWTGDDKTIMEGNEIDPDTSEVVSYLKIKFDNFETPTKAEIEHRMTVEGGVTVIGKTEEGKPYTVSEYTATPAP